VITPGTAHAIDDLEFSARTIVESFRSGLHRSPFHGFAAEFSQHRSYRHGDDLKYLDWKILARTDRLYTRQFSETTNLSVMLVVDASASMDFPRQSDMPGLKTRPPSGHVTSKFAFGVLVAAALAYLIIEQGDAAGLITMADDKFVYLPARGGRSHRRALIAALSRLEPRGSWSLDRSLVRAGELLKRRGVVLAVSDFYDATADTYRELRRIRRRGHDVSMLQVLSPEEIGFPFTGETRVEDLETQEVRHVDAGAAAAGYRAAVAEFLTGSRSQALRDGHDYFFLGTDVAPERALRSYLLRRSAQS
jgi:uncharacterized protein (DUF58 family)